MAETEAGWTKEDPKVDGVYWWRADRMDFEPDVHYVTNGKFYEVGEQFSRIVEGFGGEWLGPITVSDAEQLIELRRAARGLMEAAQFSLSTPGLIRGVNRLHNCVEAVAAVLNPQQQQETRK